MYLEFSKALHVCAGEYRRPTSVILSYSILDADVIWIASCLAFTLAVLQNKWDIHGLSPLNWAYFVMSLVSQMAWDTAYKMCHIYGENGMSQSHALTYRNTGTLACMYRFYYLYIPTFAMYQSVSWDCMGYGTLPMLSIEQR